MQSPLAVIRRLTLVPQGIIIVISAFLPIFAIVSMFPAVPTMIEHFADNPNARKLVPLMVSAPGLAIAFVAPFAGLLVDKFGRVPLLVWATLCYGFFGVAPFFLDSLMLIFATRLGLGVCEAAIITVVNTLLGDYWDDEGRRDWLFMQGIAGPFMGALVIRVAGPVTEIMWNGVFLIYGVAFVIFVLMKLYLFEPKADKHAPEPQEVAKPFVATTSESTPFPVRTMVIVASVTLFTSAIYYTYMISGALVFNAVGVTSPSRISELTAWPALMVIVGAVVFRVLGGRPNGVQLGAFFAFLGTGLTMMGLADSVPQVVAGVVVQQVGIGMSIPVLIAWTQTKLPFQYRGLGMGIWTGTFFFGLFSSPFFVERAEGIVGSIQGAFTAAGIAALAAAVIGFVWAATHRARDADVVNL